MKIVVTIARILLGLVFVVFGSNGFLNFIPVPPMEGFAGQFLGVLAGSHYLYFICGVEIIAGLLLLTNAYVPLALTMLAAVLANILVYHVTMMPAGLPLALVTTVLWFIVAWPLRLHFAQLLFVRTVRS